MAAQEAVQVKRKLLDLLIELLEEIIDLILDD
jgi:hypothetical protein